MCEGAQFLQLPPIAGKETPTARDIPSPWGSRGFPPWIRLRPDPSSLPPLPQGAAAQGEIEPTPTTSFAGVESRGRCPCPTLKQAQRGSVGLDG